MTLVPGQSPKGCQPKKRENDNNIPFSKLNNKNTPNENKVTNIAQKGRSI
jgi:hypothetical protein